jgi:release factor glutamine methyltransferase
VNLRKQLESARDCLADRPAARLEAEILLAHALDSPRSFLYANPDLELPRKRRSAFNKLVRRRARGEPIAYITGEREFWSLPLCITRDVLIPRAETELLVEEALQLIPADSHWRLADLGTGSGAIALALATERRLCQVHATDSSPAALDLAGKNARRLGLATVLFHEGSWAEPLTGQFDLIVSNPPYVAEDDPHLEEGDCRFEPRHALTPGKDALAAIRVIAVQAHPKLSPRGWLLLEHGPDQGSAVRAILAEQGFESTATRRDLLGHERVTLGRKPGGDAAGG